SLAFVSASFERGSGLGDPTGEVETRSLEMFAWDREAAEYRFYATEPTGDEAAGLVELEVGPERCQGCHLTPSDLASTHMHALPIMNEMTQPWTHWNAEPGGFISHEFALPKRFMASRSFRDLFRPMAGGANVFEQIVRAGQARVVTARTKTRDL